MSDLQCPARILLIRHAEATYEAPVTTGSGGTLSARGRQQAREAASHLQQERVVHVYSSMLARAVQTSELVAQRLGVEVTAREGLEEFDPGVHLGSPHDSGWAGATMQAWAAGDLDARWEGGESAREIATRVTVVLEEVADLHRGETVVVVAHGGAILATLASLGRPDLATDLSPCAGVILERDGDGWRHTPGGPGPTSG
ncbi:histidine phosphatase family protein [Serinicoccus kebangsaanensis]|uniref:histidine phosphatase family protein n=1 Tax=Serinicoccus kebangsaanensis TaxID=2602069 RepID=UPI00124D82DA|nr:histidine phosphatase family protein [Serinicoccus kebangsaanensis]